jgi:hypothetical protein
MTVSLAKGQCAALIAHCVSLDHETRTSTHTPSFVCLRRDRPYHTATPTGLTRRGSTPTASTLQQKLQGMTDAYAIASDGGSFVKGLRCFASMNADTGTWEKREQQKSLLRRSLRRTFKLQEAWGLTQKKPEHLGARQSCISLQ